MAQEAFPLHFLVWNNQYLELDRELQKTEVKERRLFYFVASGMVFDLHAFDSVALHCADAAPVFLFFLATQQDVERLDPRGRTPLELAVCLGHMESTRVLLRHSSDPTHCNTQGWTSELCVLLLRFHMYEVDAPAQSPRFVRPVLQEAVSTGDPELVQLVLQYRDFKRATERLAGIPELLSKLRQV